MPCPLGQPWGWAKLSTWCQHLVLITVISPGQNFVEFHILQVTDVRLAIPDIKGSNCRSVEVRTNTQYPGCTWKNVACLFSSLDFFSLGNIGASSLAAFSSWAVSRLPTWAISRKVSWAFISHCLGQLRKGESQQGLGEQSIKREPEISLVKYF